MSGLIAKEWASYREAVMSPDAPEIQVQENRRAFYAGAQGFLGLMMRTLDPGLEPTDADLRGMDLLARELTEFARDVAEGRA